MKYKHNERRRRSVSVVNIILGLLVVFLLYVALTCSSEAREGNNFTLYEDGSFVYITNDGVAKYGCLQYELCNKGD